MAKAHSTPPLFDREISFLRFNERVLQEAEDARHPLLERLRFLAIFSSNLDEFFRVRVASLRSLMRLSQAERDDLEFSVAHRLKAIHQEVSRQQERFGRSFREHLLPALSEAGIYWVLPEALPADRQSALRKYFAESVEPHLDPSVLKPGRPTPFLENRRQYLYLYLEPQTPATAAPLEVLLPMPIPQVPRFVSLDAANGEGTYVLWLDDVLRFCADDFFEGYCLRESYAMKLNRDAELYLDDEFQASTVEKVKRSLGKRETGLPTRFLYDEAMSKRVLDRLCWLFELDEADLSPGGRYHNFDHLWDFPDFGRQDLCWEPLPAVPHLPFELALDRLHQAVAQGDQALFLPYQPYDYLLTYLHQAAVDPEVTRIQMTLYRIADDSAVARALMKALEAGKSVFVFVEVRARFDEAGNIYWGRRLEEAGAEVMYSHEHLKVHAKLLLVSRGSGPSQQRQAVLSTGNFNEKTARVYSDFQLFTAEPVLCADVEKAFGLIRSPEKAPAFEKIRSAPHGLRAFFEDQLERLIEAAQAGEKAELTVKINNLEDERMIRKLYEASNAGVRMRLLVRSICVLVPGVKGWSQRIQVRSIVGRFLEHARFFHYQIGETDELYSGSCDWMKRNLDRRVEVLFPVEDKPCRQAVLRLLELQWRDNVKARVINQKQTNAYRKSKSARDLDSQRAFYESLLKPYQ